MFTYSSGVISPPTLGDLFTRAIQHKRGLPVTGDVACTIVRILSLNMVSCCPESKVTRYKVIFLKGQRRVCQLFESMPDDAARIASQMKEYI